MEYLPIAELSSPQLKVKQLDEFIDGPEPSFSAVKIPKKTWSNPCVDDLDQLYMELSPVILSLISAHSDNYTSKSSLPDYTNHCHYFMTHNT